MFRGKEHYDKPETALARLELESPICSGSVTINNPQGQAGQINEQEFNNDFKAEFGSSEWTSKPQNSSTN